MKKPGRNTTLLAIAVAFSFSAANLTPLMADQAAAKANWGEHCSKCHGDDGKGQTKMGLKLKVKDYSDPKVQATFEDAKMKKSIAEGTKDEAGKYTMKPFADKLTEEQIVELIAYTRSLVAKP